MGFLFTAVWGSPAKILNCQAVVASPCVEDQKALAPEYFNIKYGHLEKNLDNSINIIDGYLGGDTNSNLILESVTGKPIPKGQPISSTMNNQNPPTQQNTNQPSWRDYE